MDKKTIIVGHGNPNNESWVKREFERANMLIADYTPTLITINKTRAMGKSEQMLNGMDIPGNKRYSLG